MANSPYIREALLMHDGLQTVIKLFHDERSQTEMEKLSWVLSIFAGVSVEKTLTNINYMEIVIDRFTKFLYWRDNAEILTNSLLALGLLLPKIEITEENKKVWERIIQILSHNSIVVKRACIYCLKSIMSNNDVQCHILIELNIISCLSELINYNSPEIKIEVCELLHRLIEKGYFQVRLLYILIIVNLNFIQGCFKGK